MVEVVTLGCRINSYESEILKEKFAGTERLINCQHLCGNP